MNNKLKITIALTSVFFIGMVALTFSARAIHNLSLPKVTAERLTNEYFMSEYTDENGEKHTAIISQLAIKTALLSEDIYVLYEMKKNGELLCFVRKAQVETGAEENGFAEIVSGLSYRDKIVVSSDKPLYDGCEVLPE